MKISRRGFLASGAAVTLGFLGLRQAARGAQSVIGEAYGYGPLVPDPQGLLDLPEGFSYRVISKFRDAMDDGLLVPAKPDGMGAFPGPNGLTVLVRNHELERDPKSGPYGEQSELLAKVPEASVFDLGAGRLPAATSPEGTALPEARLPVVGGTSTIVYDTREQRVVRQFLSLASTARNCAGGVTPWGSWLTCEECDFKAGADYAHDHGWVFEVPATSEPALAEPVPIKGMGRFYHEAVAVDPATGIVYMTEDRGDGLFYRFVPNRKPTKAGDLLAHGGKLQALVIVGERSRDTRNWPIEVKEPVSAEATAEAAAQGGAVPVPPVKLLPPENPFPAGQAVAAEWIDIEDVEAPKEDLRYQGFANGAARFARGEGMWWGDGAAYFACTNGGPEKRGQIWRYTPRDEKGGTIELFVESTGDNLVQNADNIVGSPWGDLIVCEDCGQNSSLVGVTPEGKTYMLGDNAKDASEFAGATFSPDGTTLFVNMQGTGVTLAITGPWRSRSG